MATSREERMQGRLRGAQRHQVEDISFGPIFPLDEELAPDPESDPKPDSESKPLHSPTLGANAQIPSSPRGPSSPDGDHETNAGTSSRQPSPIYPTTSPSPRQRSVYDRPDNTDDELPVSSTRRPGPRMIPPATEPSPPVYEEVAESPVDAPGSGQRRRRVRVRAAANQSAALQKLLSSAQRDPDRTVNSSSPIERKVRQMRRASAISQAKTVSGPDVSAAAGSSPPSSGTRRSPRPKLSDPANGEEPEPSVQEEVNPSGSPPLVADDNIDEISPRNDTNTATVARSSPLARVLRQTRRRRSRMSSNIIEAGSPTNKPSGDDNIYELSPDTSRRSGGLPPEISLEAIESSPAAVQVEESLESPQGEAEVSDREAARQLGRKRPRQSLVEASPDLASTGEDSLPPPNKRRRAAAPPSPAVQKHPGPKRTHKSKHKASAPKPAASRRRGKRKTTDAGQASGDDGEPEARGPVEVIVQRFTKPVLLESEEEAGAEGDDMVDIMAQFSNREGVNSVDVLSQLCEEAAERALRVLERKMTEAEDAAAKKEIRTKIGSVEAFREELATKLLEHTIALDGLHQLKKRFRSAEKEKRSLRDEVLRLRAERDQVALRRDALRIKHEGESKKLMRQVQLSSAMHDIELAVEEGRSAPELSAREQKNAELANLDLLMSRVGDQVRADGHGAGVLDQLKSFNAYLERTAAALQAR